MTKESPNKIPRKVFQREMDRLQLELVKVQQWTKTSGYRLIVVFEGRDAAGKGGMIKRITAPVSPRVFRKVALPAPNDRERTQYYLQRYLAHFPSAGEIVIFDRSWYNRAVVEPVNGFCTEKEYRDFMRLVPGFERTVIESGIHLVKYWLTVSQEEQKERFEDRIEEEEKNWKLSPMDMEARRRWYDYSRYRDAMFDATDTDYAPWFVVQNDDKRRGQLSCISHLLSLIPYSETPFDAPELPDPDPSKAYDDVAALRDRTFVQEYRVPRS